MSEMIERMVAAARRHMAETGADFNSVDEGLAGLARAMFTAARDSTEEMESAGALVFDDDLCDATNAMNMWQAMCDEALK